MVCNKDWEPRPPQEFIKGIKDDQSTPFSRPDPTEGRASAMGSYSGAIPGWAIPGQAIPGYDVLPPPELLIGFFPL